MFINHSIAEDPKDAVASLPWNPLSLPPLPLLRSRKRKAKRPPPRHSSNEEKGREKEDYSNGGDTDSGDTSDDEDSDDGLGPCESSDEDHGSHPDSTGS